MGFDGEAVVRDGRVVVESVPFEDGRAVRVAVTPLDEPEIDRCPPQDLPPGEWLARVLRVAKEMGERHPHGPILTDYEMSREAIYADEGE